MRRQHFFFPFKKHLCGVLFKFTQSPKYRLHAYKVPGGRSRGCASKMPRTLTLDYVVNRLCYTAFKSFCNNRNNRKSSGLTERFILCRSSLRQLSQRDLVTTVSGSTCDQVEAFFGKRPPAWGFLFWGLRECVEGEGMGRGQCRGCLQKEVTELRLRSFRP